MRTHTRTLLSVVFALLAGLSPEGLLAETDPNGAGKPPFREVTARSLAIDPTNPAVVFAGNYDGVYESRDGGESWKPLKGSPRPNVIAIDPTDPLTLYTAGYGVHKSTDGGKTWTDNSPETVANRVYALVIDPNDARRVFASSEKIFRSPDGTEHWELVLRMEDNVASYYYPAAAPAIAVAPSDSATVYAGGEAHWSEGYVSRSVDGGTTWSAPAFLYSPVTNLVVDSRNAEMVYAGTMYGFYRSSDGGATWSESGLAGMYISSLVRVPDDPSSLFAGTPAGLFTTDDSGSTWTRFEPVPLEAVISLALDATGRFLYVGTEKDVFRFKRKVPVVSRAKPTRTIPELSVPILTSTPPTPTPSTPTPTATPTPTGIPGDPCNGCWDYKERAPQASPTPSRDLFALNQSGAETCSSDRFPTVIGNPAHCCQDGNRTWHTNDNRALVFRVYGDACREADGVGTNCGVGSSPFVPCTYGPCGSRTEWVIEAESVHIFEPLSRPDKCGWEVVNILACRVGADPDGCGRPGGARSFPEPYDDQVLYSGVIATCPFRRCLIGGTPAE